jgi:hypothetical protein
MTVSFRIRPASLIFSVILICGACFCLGAESGMSFLHCKVELLEAHSQASEFRSTVVVLVQPSMGFVVCSHRED